jgi:asparagine synthase (glutamine-hydrolysing)
MIIDSVRLHLRSDVPLACALSGGLDSSAIACAIRRIEPDYPLHTFTYVARGFPVSEEPYADQVAAKTGAVEHKIHVSPKEIIDDLDDMIRAQGEPFGSTSIYAQYRVFKQAHESGIKVMLDGQGADELFAGYHGYPGARLRSLLDGGSYQEAVCFLRAWSNWPGRSMGRGAWALLEAEAPPALARLVRRVTGREHTRSWFRADAIELGGTTRLADGTGTPARHVSAGLRRALTAGGGLSALLRHADRNSMRWSIESRVPFLTTEIAEYVLQLPERFLVSMDGETKHVLRAAMEGVVPTEIVQRRDKIGFATPEWEWLRGLEADILPWLESLEELHFLDVEAVRRDVKATLAGNRRWDFRIWRIINLARWVKMLGDSGPWP